MRAAAEIVERRGGRFVEAPFTGSKIAAEKGELVYYVAGNDAALREARPILEASSKEIIEIWRDRSGECDQNRNQHGYGRECASRGGSFGVDPSFRRASAKVRRSNASQRESFYDSGDENA